MPQSITWLGNTYTDVGEVFLPKTSSGEAVFCDPTITTAVAADVAQGKQFLLADGSIGTGTASGGGGVQNCVIGEFTGTTPGEAMTINLPYTGSGYPIAIVVFPKEGAYKTGGTFYSKVQRYAMNTFTAVKQNDETPDWSSLGTTASVLYCYKSSSSSATNMTRTGTTGVKTFIAPGTATSTASNVVRMGSPTKLSVFIANTSYGFAAGIPYIYIVAYSS